MPKSSDEHVRLSSAVSVKLKGMILDAKLKELVVIFGQDAPLNPVEQEEIKVFTDLWKKLIEHQLIDPVKKEYSVLIKAFKDVGLQNCAEVLEQHKKPRPVPRASEPDSSIFKQPQQLIKTECKKRKLYPQVNRAVWDQLHGDDKKVIVVSIVGTYRTGKSYLMNKLANQENGFPVGSKIQGHTRGIWMIALDHPVQRDCTLVLLDTEGIGDTNKSNTNYDANIFALTSLISTTLIYNGKNAIDEGAIDKLGFTAEMSRYVTTRVGAEEDDSEFGNIFPNLIYVVRDFQLELVKEDEDGSYKEVTENEYLEDALSERANDDDSTSPRAKVRRCIKQYFPNRSCFTFPYPSCQKNLKQLSGADMNEDFVTKMDTFCQHVWTGIHSSTLENGQPLTARRWTLLVDSYVEAIRTGKTPNVGDALEDMKAKENERAMDEAVAEYHERMKELKLPTETKDELERFHNKSIPAALTIFAARALSDKGGESNILEKFLKLVLEGVKETYHSQNKQISGDLCNGKLKELYIAINPREQTEKYNVQDGYNEFLKDVKTMQESYSTSKGLGLMRTIVLEEFQLNNIETDKQLIKGLDKKMTEVKQEIKAVQTKLSKEEKKRKEAEEVVNQWKMEREKIHIRHGIAEKELKEENARLRAKVGETPGQQDMGITQQRMLTDDQQRQQSAKQRDIDKERKLKEDQQPQQSVSELRPYFDLSGYLQTNNITMNIHHGCNNPPQ